MIQQLVKMRKKLLMQFVTSFKIMLVYSVLKHCLRRCKEILAIEPRVRNIHLKDKSKVFNTARVEALEVENLYEVAKATLISAAARKECRGAHTVVDYEESPDHPAYPYGRRDDEWMKHTLWYSSATTVLNTSQYVISHCLLLQFHLNHVHSNWENKDE
jgi:succinate dehydrogenase/fumarate reductase flavoprotein subunit